MDAGLPNVPGPKTYPFESGSKQLQIDFINEIGSGLHGVVWKVKINGEIFALKIVSRLESICRVCIRGFHFESVFCALLSLYSTLGCADSDL